MRKLNWYIGTTVAGTVLVVLMVIVALDAIAALVDQLGELKGNYTFTEALIYVGMTLPSRIYSNISFASLVGCLIGLGMLAGTSELVVMRAAGVSVLQITLAVIRPVLLFVVIGVAIGEFAVPTLDEAADSRRALAQGDRHALESQYGLWNREEGEFMHFNTILPGGILHGITRYRFDDSGKLITASFAKEALFENRQWRERDIKETQFAEDHIGRKDIESREWDTRLTPRMLRILTADPETLSILSLHRYSRYLDRQNLDNEKYQLSLWKKVLQPAATISLVLIAVSFIFGPLREVTTGYRIFTGVIVGIVFQTTQDLLGPASLVYGFPPLLASLIPISVCAGIGLFLLSRTR